MQIDCSAVVFQLLDCAVNVDAVVLVGQVPFQLAPAAPVHPQLLVD